MHEERAGQAHEDGMVLTVAGERLGPGDPAPDFALEHFGREGMRTVHLHDSAGSVRLVSVLNSIDTPVCDVQTRRWGELEADLAGVVVVTVSMDLPFALSRWTQATGSGHLALSAHRSEDFGRAWGVLITEWRALQRAVFVVDGTGTVTYAEYVADQGAEPDYAAALDAARAAAGGAVGTTP